MQNKISTLTFKKPSIQYHTQDVTKLHCYGIQGKLLIWIQNFLCNREQKVIINGEESSPSCVTSGIPQGSVLGPILFSICINDLLDVVNNITKLLADDTDLYSAIESQENVKLLQEDIKKNEQMVKHLAIKI